MAALTGAKAKKCLEGGPTRREGLCVDLSNYRTPSGKLTYISIYRSLAVGDLYVYGTLSYSQTLL